MKYKYLTVSGALNEADADNLAAQHPRELRTPTRGASLGRQANGGPTISLDGIDVPQESLELLPESVARENLVLPLGFDGEKLTCAAADPEDLALADRLRFLLAKDVRLVRAERESLLRAIHRHYGDLDEDLADSMLQEFCDTAIDLTTTEPEQRSWNVRTHGSALATPSIQRRVYAPEADVPTTKRKGLGRDHLSSSGRNGMFFYTVPESQRVLRRGPDGTMEIIAGPRRVWKWRSRFEAMEHYIAHPGEFLIVRFRDGRQQHFTGPAEIWFDPRVHLSVEKEDALQVSAKEAVVVYSQGKNSDAVLRRIVYGPTLFTPEPGEWLHRFSWHASKGGSHGASKKPNSLVFHKLWLMPDQMYHDVPDVRTADDAVLTIRLMIFFELIDIERMLDSTHDPIGDFVNAATSDVVEFTGQRDFEGFKRETDKLNQLETYKQLTKRGQQCGYRITNVVYRGYGAPPSLQQMHDQAIEARTRLKLERATEQQAQDLENYKLECQLQRAGKRRAEQSDEVAHDLELAARRREAELHASESKREFQRRQRQRDAELHEEIRRHEDARQQEHLAALREMNVDLTAYLTQARADRVIELRGAADAHVHLDRLEDYAAKSQPDGSGNGGLRR